jgi:hypothetical protein
MPYMTAAKTYALTNLTAFGRTLIDDADAAAGRITLGLGTSAVVNTGTSGAAVPLLNGANTWSALNTWTVGGESIRLQSASSTVGPVFMQFRTSSGTPLGYIGVVGANDQLTLGRDTAGQLNIIADTAGTLNFIGNPQFNTPVPVSSGGTGAATAAAARTNLGLGGLATMNASDLMYTGTSASNLNFPVTSYLAVSDNGSVNRNAAGVITLYTGNSAQYVLDFISGAGSTVAGTWRQRGLTGANIGLYQRTA